jgi:hypothetical protein
MTDIADLIPDVQAVVPEVPSFIAQREFIRATREFSEETRAWRVSFNLDVVAGTATYDLTPKLGSTNELVDIISVKPAAGGAPVKPRTYVWLDENHSDWRNETAEIAQWYVLDGNNTIRLVFTPAVTTVGTIDYFIRAAVKPLVATATTIQDLIANKYDEVLVHGALARLLFIPRKPWTDLNLGNYHRTEFEMGIIEARGKATDEHQRGVKRTVKYGGL